MRRFDPVFLPEDRRPNGRINQTFLRHFARCPRSGYLTLLYAGGAQTREMVRGSAVHAAVERAVKLMVEMGESTIPPEVAKTILDEVLGEMPVCLEDHDLVREQVYRWSAETAIEPTSVVACETLFAMDVGGYQVRCRVDLAQLTQDGGSLLVQDLKTSRAAPTQEEISRRRGDGSLAARDAQLVLYALALVFGVPVREEECERCDDAGEVPHPDMGGGTLCPECLGRRRIETPEPFPVAARAQHLHLEFVFPGIEDRDGKMLRRPLTLTRLELEEYRSSLEALVTRVSAAERTGDWPAVVSDAACSECPAAVECPIPAQLRDHRGTINTVEDFAEAAQVLDREKAEHRARQTEARNFVKANGGRLRAGNKVWELVYSEYEKVVDKEGLFDAVERAVNYGEDFDRARFVRLEGRTDLKARDLTAQELAEEERNGGRDAGLDERFGAEPPY